jgi:hypothetical protein
MRALLLLLVVTNAFAAKTLTIDSAKYAFNTTQPTVKLENTVDDYIKTLEQAEQHCVDEEWSDSELDIEEAIDKCTKDKK